MVSQVSSFGEIMQYNCHCPRCEQKFTIHIGQESGVSPQLKVQNHATIDECFEAISNRLKRSDEIQDELCRHVRDLTQFLDHTFSEFCKPPDFYDIEQIANGYGR